MISKLNWKMPTWKGLIGLIGVGYAAVTQLSHSGALTTSQRAFVGGVGTVLLTVERVADAMDYKTDNPAPIPPPTIVDPRPHPPVVPPTNR